MIVLPWADSPTPIPTPTENLLFEPDEQACFKGVDSKGTLCRWVYDTFGKNETLAESSDWLIAKPGKILVILLVAWLIRRLVHRAIDRMCKGLADGTPAASLGRGRAHHNGNAHGGGASAGSGTAQQNSTLAIERRHQRAATVSSVLRSVSTGVIYAVAILSALAEIGLNIGPLIASAGIIGVALGFGAQSLVKDFLSGIFMVIEDQYGVGDVTDLGDAVGTVEAVGLRVTRLRDINGTVWYVRNGEILRVGNKSQGWARAVVDVDVAYGEDIDAVRELMLRTATELFAAPEHAALVLEKPEVWGVEALSADAVVVRLVVKTVPLQQWKVARLLREQIKEAFDAAGVEMPFPQRTIWVRTEGDEDGAAPEPDPAGSAGETEDAKPAAAGRRSRDPLDPA